MTRTGNANQVGRIYLDLHPREGKFKHAAQFTLVSGIAGRHLPEGALVCNMPRALMEHDDVVTLFHEFGHLVHHLIGGCMGPVLGRRHRVGLRRAPSQMLEEWAWDADVLRTFARNASGEAIGADLVDRMRRADDFGKGYQARTQMFYAALSYHLHREQPADIRARTAERLEARAAVPLHRAPVCRRAALDGYSTDYYMWSRWSSPRISSRLSIRPTCSTLRSRAATETGSWPRVATRTPPIWSRTSSAGPAPSTPTRRG